jgi:DNA-binding transcriptional regulator/RsmH inhibitor MraZ
MVGEVAVLGYLDRLEVWNQKLFFERISKNTFAEEDYETLSKLGI